MRTTRIGLQVLLGLVFFGSSIPKLLGMQDAIRDQLDLAPWFWVLTGLVELTGAIGLLISLRFPVLRVPASLWLSALMIGALFAHIRVGDSIDVMMAPATLLLLSLIVVMLSTPPAASVRRRIWCMANG